MKKTVNTEVVNLKNGIINQINESGLPMCVVEVLLENILAQVRYAAKLQLEQDMKEEVEENEGQSEG